MKGFIFWLTISIIIFFLLLVPTRAQSMPSIVINELMANPVGSDSGNEWIELFNSTSQPIDLNNWELKDKSSSYSLNGTIISPNEYLVIYPSFSLNNSDEIITLTDSNGYEDIVSYTSSSEGKSLERINSDCEGFVVHPDSDSKGSINNAHDTNYCLNSQFSILSRQSDSDWSDVHNYLFGSSVEFKLNNIDEVKSIQWQIGAEESTEFSFALIPTQANSQQLTANLRLNTGETFDIFETVNIDPIIKLNEVFPDPDGADSGKEWVELYNPNDFAVDLIDWKLLSGNKVQTLEGTINAKSWLTTTTDFSLTNTGATIELLTSNELITDTFTYEYSEKDQSWAREIDGEGEWNIAGATRGYTNFISGESEGEVLTANSQQPIASYIDLPILEKPNLFYSIQTVTEPNTQNPPPITTVKHPNKIAFATLFTTDLGSYFGLVLNSKQRRKIFDFLLKIIKG